MRHTSVPPSRVALELSAAEREPRSFRKGVNTILGVLVIIILASIVSRLPLTFDGSNPPVHPDVYTPVTMSTYLKAAGFNADSPTVKVGRPVTVPTGVVPDEQIKLLGIDQLDASAAPNPGVYYPVQIKMGAQFYLVAVEGKKLVIDSHSAKATMKFIGDPMLTDELTRHYGCDIGTVQKCPKPYTSPALLQSKVDYVRNGGIVQLIWDNLDYLKVPPGMVPPH